MDRLIVANWKANLSLVQTEKWLVEFSSGYRPAAGIHVILAVPFPFLIPLRQRFKSMAGVSWAVQDVSCYPPGNYTGAVPAAWLNDLAEYALIGHRERRKYFHETVQDVANKASEAIAEEIKPILCVDTDIARQQAAAMESDDLEHLLVAYTPSDAEQLEIARSTSSVADGIERVAALFPGCPVLYGGGVNAGNAAELFRQPSLAGVLVAGGCLNSSAFVELLRKVSESMAL